MNSLARNPKAIGNAIRRRRTQIGLSQTELGVKAGVRQATISDLENGIPSAKVTTLLSVLAALDLELSIIERSRSSASDIEDMF